MLGTTWSDRQSSLKVSPQFPLENPPNHRRVGAAQRMLLANSKSPVAARFSTQAPEMATLHAHPRSQVHSP
ncbi:MAG: hypothetical protein MUF49_29540 [Oculatellaceae cyanobacterium Prado106]|nr:hypothetical protein [Oculatellaceae cyanobacterium Prado106]